MRALRLLYFYLAAAFLLGVVVQFFLAGLGSFGATDFDPHRAAGFALLLLAVLLLVVGILGRLARTTLLLTLLLAGLAVLQIVLANVDDVPEVAALHVVNALVIFGLAHQLMRRTAFYVRSKSAA